MNKLVRKVYPRILGSGRGMSYPPVTENLLAFLRGNSSDTEKLDSYKKPLAENFTMSQSPCVALNGVDEYGTLSSPVVLSGNFTVEINVILGSQLNSYPYLIGSDNTGVILNVGSGYILIKISGINYAFNTIPVVSGKYIVSRHSDVVTVAHNDVSESKACSTADLIITHIMSKNGSSSTCAAGTVFCIALKDSTQDIHFRLAEGKGLISYSDDYLNDGHYITWSGVEADIRAGRQNLVHDNATKGFGYARNLIQQSENLDTAPWNLLNDSGNAYVSGNTYSVEYGDRVRHWRSTALVAGTRYVISFEASSLNPHMCAWLRMYDYNVDIYQRWAGSLRDGMFSFTFTPNVSGKGVLTLEGWFNAPAVTAAVSKIHITEDIIPEAHGTIVRLGDSYPYKSRGLMANVYTTSTIIEKGIAGEKLTATAQRFDADVIGNSADVVMLWGGVIDLIAASSDPNASMRAAIEEMCGKADTNGISVVLLNIPPFGENVDYTEEKGQWQASFNAWLEQYASDNGHMFIDVYSLWDDGNGNLSEYLKGAGDGLYPEHPISFCTVINACTKVLPRSFPDNYAPTVAKAFKGTERLPFLNDHKGNTFNNSGTSFAPATTPVGTGNGVDKNIRLSGIQIVGDFKLSLMFRCDLVGSTRQGLFGYRDTTDTYCAVETDGSLRFKIAGISQFYSTAAPIVSGEIIFMSVNRIGSNVTVTIRGVAETFEISDAPFSYTEIFTRSGSDYFNGVIRNFTINNITIPINEGSGYDIHDSEGNIVGTLSGDETFWDGAEMVSDEIIKQEAIKTTPVFTDGNGHPVAQTQAELEANAEINTNKQDYLRTGTKTELAVYSEIQSTENDTKLLEWITT